MIIEKDGKKFRMVCFKTPLEYEETLRKQKALMTLSDVIEHYKKEHSLEIKKVIDLTTGLKFYQR